MRTQKLIPEQERIFELEESEQWREFLSKLIDSADLNPESESEVDRNESEIKEETCGREITDQELILIPGREFRYKPIDGEYNLVMLSPKSESDEIVCDFILEDEVVYLRYLGVQITLNPGERHVCGSLDYKTDLSQNSNDEDTFLSKQHLEIINLGSGGVALKDLGSEHGSVLGLTESVDILDEKLSGLFELAQRAKEGKLEVEEDYIDSLESALKNLGKRSRVEDLNRQVPTIFIPDIHARVEFLPNLFLQRVPELNYGRIWNLLKNNEINIICGGDAIHSENILNWPIKFQKRVYKGGRKAFGVWDYDSEDSDETRLMATEGAKNLAIYKMIWDLISQFQNFSYLGGNHDNFQSGILKGGVLDFSNGEREVYVDQSGLLRKFIEGKFSPDFLKKLISFTESLPILAKGDNFLSSHAPPKKYISGIEEIKNPNSGRNAEKTKLDLTWSGITQTSRSTIDRLLSQVKLDVDKSFYITGHISQNKGYGTYFRKMITLNSENSMPYLLVPAKELLYPAVHCRRVTKKLLNSEFDEKIKGQGLVLFF